VLARVKWRELRRTRPCQAAKINHIIKAVKDREKTSDQYCSNAKKTKVEDEDGRRGCHASDRLCCERAGDELNANCHPIHGLTLVPFMPSLLKIWAEEVSHWIPKLVSKAQKP
jgi:hypothetical protein